MAQDTLQTQQTQVPGMTQVDPTTGVPLVIPGAGTVVATNPNASVPTIQQGDQQVVAAPTDPTAPNEVDQYLNTYQQSVFEATNTPTTPGLDAPAAQLGMNEIKDLVAPSTPKPVAPNLEQTYNDLRGTYGLTAIESTINTLKEQIRNETLITQQRQTANKNEKVRLDVIGGRANEIEVQQRERLAELNNTLTGQIDLANSAYNTINQITQFKQMDFNNAARLWETEFSQNMQLYQAFQTQSSMEQQQATANLQIYSNLITSGNMQYSSLSPDQKLELNKLEIKSGLGKGFLEGLKMTPGADIKSITQRVDPKTGMGYADTIYINPDGSLRVVTTELGKTGLSAQEQLDQKKTEIDQMAKLQDSLDKKYKTGKYAPKTSSGGGGSSSSTTKSEEKIVVAFKKSLANPGSGVNVAATVAQEKAFKQQGKSYITREQLISKLKTLYPSIDPNDIARSVYGYYPDK